MHSYLELWFKLSQYLEKNGMDSQIAIENSRKKIK